MNPNRKEDLAKFLENPTIKKWYTGSVTDLKPSTRDAYALHLMNYFQATDPAVFLKAAEDEPKETALEVKTRLAQLYEHSMTGAAMTKYALRNLIQFYDLDMHINGRLRVKRTRKKHEFTWEESEKVILEAPEPYRSIFQFLRMSGLGEDEFAEIQSSAEIQAEIEAQRGNDKPYVKITLEPRKSNTDDFFTLCPKEYVPKFPVLTKKHSNRGGQPIDAEDLQHVWRRAARRTGLWHVGLGPHSLRSVFRTSCDGAGVRTNISEYCMGHGSDEYGYSRPGEELVAKELSKYWNRTEPATQDSLRERDERISQLESELKKLRDEFESSKATTLKIK
jgi:hypothetical protein